MPLSDGEEHDEFNGLVDVPERWLRAESESRNATVAPTSRDKGETKAVTTETDAVMVYDSETNQLVPLISIE